MNGCRFWIAIALALPACTTFSTEDASTASVAQSLPDLTVGDAYRVTLRPTRSSWRSSSQVTYEGTVVALADDVLTIASTSTHASSHSRLPLGESLPPFITRLYESSAEASRPTDETITVPLDRIERIESAEQSEASASEPE